MALMRSQNDREASKRIEIVGSNSMKAADQHTDRHRRIIMRARDVAAGKNHHHQCRSNGERGNHAVTPADYRAADCQDKKESSDEFGNILIHEVHSYPTQAGKSKTDRQWDFGLVLESDGQSSFAKGALDLFVE
jgi:phage terminase large subunit-like protein